jgi:hypothetical protein
MNQKLTGEAMKEFEALALLKSELHSKVVYTGDGAKRLVRAAEYMPLKLSQTARQINMRYPKFDFAQAIEKLDIPDQYATSFLESSIHESNRDIRQTNSIVQSWHLSIRYIRDKHPAAARLHSPMCLFDRQDVSEVLLAKRYDEKTAAATMPARRRQPWWTRYKRLRRSQRTVERGAFAREGKTTSVDDWRAFNDLVLIETSIEGDNFSMHWLIQHTKKRWLEMNDALDTWSKNFVHGMVPKHDHDNRKLCQ